MTSHLYLAGDKIPADAQVHAYRAHEGISLPYAVEIDLSTADTAFCIDDCLRHRVLLEVDDGQGNVRHYDGLPDKVGFRAVRGEDFFFYLRIRPALAALEHREGSRIWQGKSPVDVIKEILKEAGVDRDVEWRLRQTYAAREFLTQYHETEMAFVHRLLEDEGIFYFFNHSPEGHRLIFADDPSAFAAAGGARPAVLSARQSASASAQPLVGFSRRKALRPTRVVLRDYDFEKPGNTPEASLPAHGNWPLTHYEYPGGFTAGAEGQRRARDRISALRGDVDVCRGKSRAAGLACGAPLSVEGAVEPFLNGDYIVVELRSEGSAEGAGSPGEACRNDFLAIPKDAPFAAPRRARKPKIRGIQTAVVTGATNEPQAIHVDKYGRIKVRFLWDRSGKTGDDSSCWVRVSQLAMGGSMVLPRVGWEVSVAFLDGDPDRPIVLGRTYNAEHTPPYAQPGASADSSLKSMATPGGAGHNEIKMSDAAGKQGFGLSSQKDLNIATGHDKHETVGVDEEHSVGSNYNVTIGVNETTTVGGAQKVDVGNALQVKVTGAQSIAVGGSEQAHAKCDYVEKVGGTRDYHVGGNQMTLSNGVRQDITGAWTREVGAVQASVSVASIHDNMLATYDEDASLAVVQLVAGVVAEDVTGAKDETSAAGALHAVQALSTSASGVKQFIGGVHLRKISDDFVVQAPKIILGGGVGKFHAGGSKVDLDGGPVVMKGSKIAIEAGAIVKLAANLKIG